MLTKSKIQLLKEHYAIANDYREGLENLMNKYLIEDSVFVYKNGILGLKFSLTTAIGFFQSIICVIFLLLANWISRKLGERGIW